MSIEVSAAAASGFSRKMPRRLMFAAYSAFLVAVMGDPYSTFSAGPGRHQPSVSSSHPPSYERARAIREGLDYELPTNALRLMGVALTELGLSSLSPYLYKLEVRNLLDETVPEGDRTVVVLSREVVADFGSLDPKLVCRSEPADAVPGDFHSNVARNRVVGERLAEQIEKTVPWP